MEKFSYYKTRDIRRNTLSEYGNKDHIFFKGKNNVLISVPHGIVQTRLGKQKGAEIGTIPMGIILAKNTNSHIIIKTKNNYDDANFDINCPYRSTIADIIKKYNIKYLIDLHGLSRKSPYDINLGTRLEQNTSCNKKAFEDIYNLLSKEFKVVIDQPFMASTRTISGHFSKHYGIWAIQVETNCGLTNSSTTIDKFNRLVQIFTVWIKTLN